MANPTFVDCSANTWAKVAEKVITGFVHNKLRGPQYLQTYRMNGDPAPTEQNEGVQIFVNSDTAQIAATADIDVYIMSLGKDGKVRVDLP